jgi:hypothetical protein
MRKEAWCINLVAAGLVLVILTCGGCTRTREIEVGDVVRLNCEHPEWATGRGIEKTERGTYLIQLFTSHEAGAEIAGTIPCGYRVTIADIHEWRGKVYEVEATVGELAVRGWLRGITLEDHLELERVEE